MVKNNFFILAFIVTAICFSQTKISGSVYNEYLETFSNAKIVSSKGATTSDADGNFTIKVGDELPQVLKVSAYGYQEEEVIISSLDKKVNIILKESLTINQMVVSASRVPERIIESPVTIERLSLGEIKRAPENSFYDALENLKGVDVRLSSYTNSSVNTRGFADFTNTRFIQLVDGMDTALPALNFSMGNVNGVNELDIESVEVLQGASSALYGANAYNGLMLLTTKNPFDYEGVSAIIKSGFTKQKEARENPFYEVSVRAAHKFSDYFAGKVNFSFTKAEEWYANDMRNRDVDSREVIEGSSETKTNYDGINTYGDFYMFYFRETGELLHRTGYHEKELIRDRSTRNIKFSSSLNFRPLKDDRLEIQLASRLSLSDNIFQGLTRYAMRDYYFAQSKLEIKGHDFYVRGYYTRNNAGKSYHLENTGARINSYRNSLDWAYNVFEYYIINNTNLGEARDYADQFRPQVGSEEFKQAFNEVTTTLISENGSAFYDKSWYMNYDGNYDFKRLLNNWADIQVGGSYRKYFPNSKGTILNDKDEKIRVEDYGVYTQIQKKFINNRLKFTGSMRYDKSTNFSGHISPRVAFNYLLGENKNHNLRASYQTGFRNPTVQEQYAFLDVGSKKLIGSVEGNLARFNEGIIDNALLTKPIFDPKYEELAGKRYVKSEYGHIKPEKVNTVEFGYRSLLSINNTTNLDIDFNAFYSKHDDFIFYQDILVPLYGKVFPDMTVDEMKTALENHPEGDLSVYLEDYAVQDGVVVVDLEGFNALFLYDEVSEYFLMTNAKSQVNSYGFGIGLHTKFLKNFDVGVNYNYIDFDYENKDLGFEPNFNSPKHTVKVQLGNEKLFENFGFNVSGRWLDKYRWVSSFATADVDERTVIDAQVNYRIPLLKSTFKLGGTNLFGKEYQVAPGTGNIGNTYYLSWIINN